jgi:SWI/SNF-related matrix-associated actin-dependent regulator 1 of chromatin subfamily A
MKGSATVKGDWIEINIIDHKMPFAMLVGYRRTGKDTAVARNTEGNISSLRAFGVTIRGTTQRVFTEIRKEFDNILYPFQKEGIQLIYKFKKRMFIADDMGLGKSIQAIAFMANNPKHIPAVVICPASAKYSWEQEILKWWPEAIDLQVLESKSNIRKADIYVINYDILRKFTKYFRNIRLKTLVIDEFHYIKDSEAKRTKAVKAMGKKIPYIIGLSGTPVENRPIEMFNMLNILRPGIFWNRSEYAIRFCDRKKGYRGWDDKGASNLDILNHYLRNNVMVRRLKKNVLKELPDKTIIVVPVAIDNREEYLEAKDDMVSWLNRTSPEKAEKAKKTQQLAKFNYLLQLTGHGKLNFIFNWIDDFVDSGHNKLVLFAWHRFMVDALMDRYNDIAVKIDGSVNSKQRHQAVTAFQTDSKIQLFVGNIRAASEAITLTAANYVGILQTGLVPSKIQQAVDRVHRISQDKKVFVYHFIAKNTFEEDVYELIDKKIKIISEMVDGVVASEDSLITELIKRMEK